MSTRETLLNLFRKLDVSGDGHVTRRELCEGLRTCGVSPQTVEKLMKKLDVNGDGVITFGEYKWALGFTDDSAQEWIDLFHQLDRDGDGYVTIYELQKHLLDTGLRKPLSAVEAWINELDVDGDGKLSYGEFMSFAADQIEKRNPDS